jgi:Protein of unknown function (DUF2510)/Phospholipase_D-nuclease N-terminal
MTGQIAGPSAFSLELVALIVGISMIAGAVDLIRQPGWAWKRAEESKAAYLVLVVLVPIIGLALYVFKGRPKVSAIAADGRAASLPFERFGEEPAQAQYDAHWPIGGVAAPLLDFDAFQVAADHSDGIRPGGPDAGDPEPATFEVSGTFFSAGTATKTRSGVGLVRAYRPRQRTTLATAAAPLPGVAPVPAGWKADPAGRHQFRYWDGFAWTENVADAGQQSRDAVAT